MNILALVVARMGSSRLPGKTLAPLAGMPVLELLVRRVLPASGVQGLCIATSDRDADTPIADLARRLGLPVFRGSEQDVLQRQIGAAEAHGADAVAELTADNPFVDARLVDTAVALYRQGPPNCYVHTDLERVFPLGYVCQVYSLEAMRQARDASAPGSPFREHPNLHLYRNPEQYPPLSLPAWEGAHRPELRLTMDYPEDYALARAVFEAPGADPLTLRIEDVVRFVDARPDIARLNAHCRQHRPNVVEDAQ